jgi:hypothetical protein
VQKKCSENSSSSYYCLTTRWIAGSYVSFCSVASFFVRCQSKIEQKVVMCTERNTRGSSFLVGRSMRRRTQNSYVQREAYQDVPRVVVVAADRRTA